MVSLYRGGEREKKKWRKRACSIFTTHFIRAQRDGGGRKTEQRCPCSSSASSLTFAPNCWRVGLKLPLARSPVIPNTRRLQGSAFHSMPPHCFQSGFFTSVLLYISSLCVFFPPFPLVSEGVPDIQLESLLEYKQLQTPALRMCVCECAAVVNEVSDGCKAPTLSPVACCERISRSACLHPFLFLIDLCPGCERCAPDWLIEQVFFPCVVSVSALLLPTNTNALKQCTGLDSC